MTLIKRISQWLERRFTAFTMYSVGEKVRHLTFRQKSLRKGVYFNLWFVKQFTEFCVRNTKCIPKISF